MIYASCTSDNIVAENDIIECCEIPPLTLCIDGATIYVPNAFTPNDDGVNDKFRPHFYNGVESINSFRILDLEGHLIYSAISGEITRSSNNGWNGELSNGEKMQGVYKYELEIININGELFTAEGHVCNRPELNRPCIDLEKHCGYETNHDGNGGFDPLIINDEPDCE